MLLLISLLAAAAVPFTAAWINSADVHQATSQLEQAVRLAKARALRNAVEALDNQPAARLFHDPSSNQVRVCQNQLLNTDCTAVWWQTTLPNGVSLAFDAGATQLAFNNRGTATTGAVSYTLGKGNEELLGQVH